MPSDRSPALDTVQGRGFRPLGDLGELGAEATMRRPSVGRDHHPAGDVVLEMGCRRWSGTGHGPWRRSRRRRGGAVPAISGRHDGLGVADAGGHPVEDGQLPPLGDFDSRKEEVVGLLRVRWLEHRQARGDGISAVVLFVLRGGHARVVGADDDQGAADARVRGREERIRGDVEPNVLHRDDDSGVGEGGAEPDLEGDLLVGRPLRPAAERVEGLENLGGWGARIAGPERDARVKRGEGDGLVAGEELSIHSPGNLVTVYAPGDHTQEEPRARCAGLQSSE